MTGRAAEQPAFIRPYREDDRDRLVEISIRTADAGQDATGILSDDALWPVIFLLPYVAQHPDLAFVVDAGDGTAIGFVVSAPVTREFERWFHDEWWPPYAARHPRPDAERSREDGVLLYAYGRDAGAEPYGDEYPAHLHIDLLPDAQGQGWGRRLIETLVAELWERGVTGLHLTADLANTGALAFYRRVGFTPIPSHSGVQTFARRLDAPAP